jgi:hypothetical protein
MQSRIGRIFQGTLFCCLAVTLPAISQDQQSQQRPTTRPAQGGQAVRPQPGGQRPGGNRPNPGGGGNRPQPSGPNPGQGNGRPQPSRPNPGRPGGRPPSRPNPGNRPPSRPNPGNRPSRPPSHRPPNWGRPPQQRPSYNFRPTDRDYLRRYYQHRFGYINRARRPIFNVGGYFPYGDIGYLSPLPPNIYGYLPPPPPGYQMGYFDGYVVVYDPLTYFIANVIDLLQ